MPKPRSKRAFPRNHLVFDVRIRDIDPVIWRRVSAPEDYTLHQLHRVFQLLFGWLDYHLYDFRAGDRRFEAPDKEAEQEDSTAVDLRALQMSVGSKFEYVYDFGALLGPRRHIEEAIPIGPET